MRKSNGSTNLCGTNRPSVTIREMALAAGVSVGTVSKVLTGSSELGRISPETVRRIHQAARDLGYKPNVNARALARRRSMTIGVYVAPHVGDRIDPLYVSPILEGICRAARDAHYDVLLIDFGTTDAELRRSLDKFQTRRVDGLIIVRPPEAGNVIAPLLEARVPIAAVDNSDLLPVNCVNIDNTAGIDTVVEYLYALGHRRIGFLGECTDATMTDHRLRQKAFVAAAERHGIAGLCPVVAFPHMPRLIPREGPFCQEDGYRGVDWLLENGRSFTALVAYNDLVAMGAMRRLAEARVDVPGEVSLVGFDDSFPSAYLVPPLTSVSHPTREMGVRAVGMLLDIIDRRAVDAVPRIIMLKPELVIRQSTAPATRTEGR